MQPARLLKKDLFQVLRLSDVVTCRREVNYIVQLFGDQHHFGESRFFSKERMSSGLSMVSPVFMDVPAFDTVASTRMRWAAGSHFYARDLTRPLLTTRFAPLGF